VESAVPPLPPIQCRRAGPSTGRVRIFATWGRAFFADAGDVPPPSQPRVVILVPSVPTDMAGGAQVQAEGAARALSGALDIVVMARSLRVPPGVEDSSGGYHVLRRPVFPLPRVRAIVDIALALVQISRLARRLRAVVAFQTLNGGLIAVIAARCFRTASIVFIRGESEYREYLDDRIARVMSGLVWRLADRVLVQSPLLVEPFLDRAASIGLSRSALARKVGVVPNGVSIPDPHVSDRAGVIFVGRLHPLKGLDVLVEALHSIEPAARPRVTIVGDGSLMQWLRTQVTDLPVDLVGELPHWQAVERIGQADILVFPSVGGDGMPNVVMEAMASGVAVIATLTAAVPHLIRDEDNGLLVPAGDAKALKDAILRLQADPILRERLGARAREAAGAMSWGAVRTRLADEIDQAAAAATRRREKQ
jgi:glycosyltransferase involved in cell wall biosynthesis